MKKLLGVFFVVFLTIAFLATARGCLIPEPEKCEQEAGGHCVPMVEGCAEGEGIVASHNQVCPVGEICCAKNPVGVLAR